VPQRRLRTSAALLALGLEMELELSFVFAWWLVWGRGWVGFLLPFFSWSVFFLVFPLVLVAGVSGFVMSVPSKNKK
jgi:hypothetical protein